MDVLCRLKKTFVLTLKKTRQSLHFPQRDKPAPFYLFPVQPRPCNVRRVTYSVTRSL